MPHVVIGVCGFCAAYRRVSSILWDQDEHIGLRVMILFHFCFCVYRCYASCITGFVVRHLDLSAGMRPVYIPFFSTSYKKTSRDFFFKKKKKGSAVCDLS